MRHIVYRTENLINNKFYYGVLNSDSKDWYLGGGRILHKAIKKYGRENFIRRTIKEFSTEEEAFLFEELIVDAVINNPMCYNAAKGGKTPNGFTGKKHTKDWIDNHIKRHTGSKRSDVTKKRISLSVMGRPQTKKRKEVINIETNQVYESALSASLETGIPYSTIKWQCQGRAGNPTFQYKLK